ncbi:phage tail family protein [Staphylococcus saprophyticus]|nr:phage tail family protein [Staphylococcus saprophyticus]
MSNFSFDGIRKNYCDYMDYKSGWGQTRELEITEVKGRPGGVLNNISEKVREIEATILVDATYNTQTLEELADDFIGWLTTNEPKPLIFDRESDKIYYAILSSQIDVERFVSFGKVTVKFTCIDPYKYASKGSTNTAISDQVSVANVGTADTPITVEATALKPSSYFMITKGDEEYFMIGDDDVDKTVKDYTPELFNTEMRTLSGWTKQSAGVINDNYTGGTTGGSFSQSSAKESVYLSLDSITAKTGWNGAEYRKSFGRSAQDFSSTVKIAVNQKKKGSTHFAQYIYDTDNRLLASIGYVNASSSQNTGRIVVTIFDQTGNQKLIYDYKNNPKFYKLEDIVIYIRLQRIENTFYVKTWKYKEVEYPKRIVPVDVNEKAWVDKGNFYKRPISSIGLYNAKNGKSNHMRTYILGSYTHEILPKPPKARDMFIKAGDKVTIDMQNENVMVNDEPMLNRKTFGSDYFNIDMNYSELFIFPTGIFDTKVYWQDRYL